MSLPETRYKNLQSFVEEQLGSMAPIVMVLKAMPLETFLGMIIKLATEQPPCDHGEDDLAKSAVFPRPHTRICARHAMFAISAKLDINLGDFPPAACDKFERYCEYFLDVAF